MWQAMRAELAYSRPFLLGGLGIATGILLLITTIFTLASGPPAHAAAGIRAMYPMMAPLIVAYIIQGHRTEEHRSRLLLAGPLTPRQIALAAALVPVVQLAIGTVASALVLALEWLITGNLAGESLQLVAYVGGLMFMMGMVALVIQEAIAAYRQGRTRAAAAGWSAFFVALLAVSGISVATAMWPAPEGPLTWNHLHLSNLILALLAMWGSVALYERRTDFTR